MNSRAQPAIEASGLTKVFVGWALLACAAIVAVFAPLTMGVYRNERWSVRK